MRKAKLTIELIMNTSDLPYDENQDHGYDLTKHEMAKLLTEVGNGELPCDFYSAVITPFEAFYAG